MNGEPVCALPNRHQGKINLELNGKIFELNTVKSCKRSERGDDKDFIAWIWSKKKGPIKPWPHFQEIVIFEARNSPGNHQATWCTLSMIITNDHFDEEFDDDEDTDDISFDSEEEQDLSTSLDFI
ncbi:unnamed protein product [Trichogramma brassicae]|uniref:Uncharacterized protein n=1 Tax=Trichogramma brassicae TaxID=86971 RepID=A0A6H5ITX1_9HYME|nr:unnamed protein product [Trichogramma brassicae]